MTDDQFLTRSMYDAMVAERDALRARLDEFDCCMCGSLMKEHGMGSGHSPVSMYDYHLSEVEAEVSRLTASLAAAHGLQARAERAEAALVYLRDALGFVGFTDAEIDGIAKGEHVRPPHPEPVPSC